MLRSNHCRMCRLFKIIILGMYITVFVIYIKSLFVNKNVDIVELDYLLRRPVPQIQKELRIQKRIVSVFAMKKKLARLPTDYKFILKWTNAFTHYDALIYKNGQQVFLDRNCTFKNCYVTNDKGLLTDVTFFDAILFDVENNWEPHPLDRSQHQQFIFVATESAGNFPICSPLFEDYYNLTWSYKLDSDITNTYINILDKNGTVVGPHMNMTWIDPMDPTPEQVKQKIKSKSKAVAWFVSNCHTKSNRRKVANNLKKALMEHGLDIDIYGWCGRLRCPKDQIKECLNVLELDYYFYLSFENSLAQDYVTEKLLHAVMHYTVPVVYGSANYSRFLPPGSYINAAELNSTTVAALINEAIVNPEVYKNYFRWHNHYSYVPAGEETNVCKLCEVLNSEPKYAAKKGFRKWWNKNYEAECKRQHIKQVSFGN